MSPPAAIREPVNSINIRPVIPAPTAKSERIELANNSVTDARQEDNNRSLELINHPNYQDQGNNNGNRRRRRSRRNDLLIKDDTIELENAENQELSDRDNDNEERKSRSSRASRRDEAPLEKVTVENG